MTTRTNKHWYNVLYWHDLTPKEQKEFDWIDDSSTLTTDDAEFIRYNRWVYCLSDCMRISNDAPEEMRAWQGYFEDTFFSCVVMRYDPEDSGRVQVGFIYS